MNCAGIKKELLKTPKILLEEETGIRKYAVFFDPDFFKKFGYDQMGMGITKTSEWLSAATAHDLKDAVSANKIVRVTEKSGNGRKRKVWTSMYIVSSTFCRTKIGELGE